MTRAQSMDVVNDSTTLQSRIDTVLSAPIMEWDHSDDIEWQPGDPLYPHPEEREDYHNLSDDGNVYETFRGGNYVRRMFDLIYDHASDAQARTMGCQKCLVSGGFNELECWSCGGKYDYPNRSIIPAFGSLNPSSFSSANSIRGAGGLMRAMTPTAERAATSVRTMSETMDGLYVHFSLRDIEFAQAMHRLDEMLFGDMSHSYRRGMLTRGYRGGRVTLDEWVTSDSGRVTIYVHPEDIRRVPPRLRVFDFDLGLPKPMVTNLRYRVHRPWQSVSITIPRGIPTRRINPPTSDHILHMRVLFQDQNLARLSENRTNPTSLLATQARRRRHI